MTVVNDRVEPTAIDDHRRPEIVTTTNRLTWLVTTDASSVDDLVSRRQRLLMPVTTADKDKDGTPRLAAQQERELLFVHAAGR